MKRTALSLLLLIFSTPLCTTNGTKSLTQTQPMPQAESITAEPQKTTEQAASKIEASAITATPNLMQLIQDNDVEAIEKLLTASPTLAQTPLITDEKPPRTVAPLKFAREILENRYKHATPKEKDLLIIQTLLDHGATPDNNPDFLPFLIQSFNRVPKQYMDDMLKILDLFLNTYQFKPSKDSYELLQTPDKKIAELLIRHGADVNATTERGILKGGSLLENVIAQDGPLWKINVLLEHGAKTNAEILKKIKELEAAEPERLTLEAVWEKSTEKLQKILENKQYAAYRTKYGQSLSEFALQSIIVSSQDDIDFKNIKFILDRQTDLTGIFASTLYPLAGMQKTHYALAILKLFARYPTVNFEGKDASTTISNYIEFNPSPNPDIVAFFVAQGTQLRNDLQKKVNDLLQQAKKETATSPLIHHAKLQSEIKQRAQEKEKKAKVAAAQGKEEAAKKFAGLTQTEAYLRGWFHDAKSPIQQLVTKILNDYYTTDALQKFRKSRKYKGFSEGFPTAEISNYQQLAEKIIEKERALQSDYYVFYHGYDAALVIMFMVQKALNNWFSLTFDKQQNLALRFKTEIQEKNVQDFIDHWEQFFLKNPLSDIEDLESGLEEVWNPWDNYASYTKADGSDGELADLMLSVNPALFANTMHSGTGSFYYFIHTPMQGNSILKNFLEAWNFDTKYLADFFAAFEAYRRPSKANGLLQIFIPKNRVDELVYLALPYGTPYRKALTPSFSEQKHRHTKISDLLDAYMQKPLSFDKKTINELEMRIVFVPSFFEPETGILYENYDFTPEKKKAAFQKEFTATFEAMVNEWLVTKAYEKVLPKTSANMPLLRLLQLKSQEEQLQKATSGGTSANLETALKNLKSQLEELSKNIIAHA